MALNKATAGKIIEIVAADPECQRRITWTKVNPALAAALPPVVLSFAKGMEKVLELGQIAGGVRNAVLMAMGREPGSKEFDEICCAGIAASVVEAIYKVLKMGGLPEVRSAPTVKRTARGIYHTANCFIMRDDSEYVFDWHATLQIRDPAINTVMAWESGAHGYNYRAMPNFN